jgi:hypothetical protein
MKISRCFESRIGFVIEITENRLVLSNTLLYEISTLVQHSSFINESSQQIKKGDRILYVASECEGNQPLIIKKVIGNSFPVAPTVKDLFSQLKFCISMKGGQSTSKLEIFLQEFLGMPLIFTTRENASVLIDIDDVDSGNMQCPIDYLFEGVYLPPFNLKVPNVSAETIAFVHKTTNPTVVKDQLELTVLSLRMLHCLFHAIGFKEHVDLESRFKESEAQKRGDPSLAASVLETNCLMCWRCLPQLAGASDGKRPVLSSQSLICSKCQEDIRDTMGLGLEDLQMIFQTDDPEMSVAVKEKVRQQKYYRYGVVYVLNSNSSEALIGLSPFWFGNNVKASKKSTMEEIEDGLLNGFNLRIPCQMIDLGSISKLEKGLKLLAEFQYSIDQDEFYFSKIEIIEKLDKLTIKKASGVIYKLIHKPIDLAVRIKMGSSIEIKDVLKAAKIVEKLAGFKVIVDEEPDTQIDEAMSKINNMLREKRQLTKDLVYQLQDILDRIQPEINDVLNKPVIIILVLPALGIPISTMGQLAVAEARSKMYILFTIPATVENVELVSKTCQLCSWNYTNGKHLKYSDYLAVFLTHELIHMTADVKDHRGECQICYLNKEEYRSLRHGACEKCIRDTSNQVHKNCLMSYACLPCIASRLNVAKNKSDFLCTECVSKLIAPSAYIVRYYDNINKTIYHDLIQKHLDEKLSEPLDRLNTKDKSI